MNDQIKKFKKDGYIDTIKILNEEDCKNLSYEQFIPKKNYTWSKSIHEKSLEVINLAKNQKIIEIIKNLLGNNNIILWSSCFIKQNPGVQHSWHIDLEYSNWKGITLWLGLKNLSLNTKLSLIKCSQQLDTFPQKLYNEGININNDNEIIKSAKILNKDCELETFNLNAGEIIVWEGKMWHKTINNSKKPREAIILQYSTTDQKIKIPSNYNSIDLKWQNKKPPCVMVSGIDKYKKNLIIDPSKIEANRKFIRQIYKIKFYLSKILRKFI